MYTEDVVKINEDYNHRDKWYGWESWTKKYVLPSGILHFRIVAHKDNFKIKVYFCFKSTIRIR